MLQSHKRNKHFEKNFTQTFIDITLEKNDRQAG